MPDTGVPLDDGGMGSETGDPSGDDGQQQSDGVSARHIRLTAVVANQAVAVPIGAEGAGIGGGGRNAPLIANRTTLLRAYVAPSEEFTARAIEARLKLHMPDGELLEASQTLTIDSVSLDQDPDSTFSWSLTPEVIVPGVEYSVELFELDGAAEVELPDSAVVDSALPATGSAPIGVETGAHRLRVAIVPITHNYGGCSTTPSISQTQLDQLSRMLENYYPVESADVQLAPGMTYSASIGSNPDFSSLLSAISQRRSADNPDPDVYYYGMVESCDGLPGGGVVGQAFGIPEEASPGLAYARVTVGRWGGSPQVAGNTFIHELGHAHGRYHVHCNGSEGVPDNNYPYPNGITGVWGWAIHGGTHFGPSAARDFMTYCGPYWVSDYGWSLAESFIAISSSWVSSRVAPDEDLIVGHIDPEGRVEAWRARGTLPGTAHASLDSDTLSLPLWTMKRPDAEGAIAFAAPANSWPASWHEGQQLTVHSDQAGPRAAHMAVAPR
jgi:hypothetical protein